MMGRGNLSFKYGSEMITLVNQFMSETEAGDFPGRFVRFSDPPYNRFVNFNTVRKYLQDSGCYGESKKLAKFLLSLCYFSL